MEEKLLEKSFQDLDLEELQKIVEGQEVPFKISFEGLQNHRKFKQFFKLRNAPQEIAKILLKERRESLPKDPKEKAPQIVRYESNASEDELKLRRIKLKEKELELKELKFNSLTAMNDVLEQVLHILKDMDKRLSVLEFCFKKGGEKEE